MALEVGPSDLAYLEGHHRNFLAEGSDSSLAEKEGSEQVEEDSGELLHWLPGGLSMVLSTRNSWREYLMLILVELMTEGYAPTDSVAVESMSEVVEVQPEMEVSLHLETSAADNAYVVFGGLHKQLGPLAAEVQALGISDNVEDIHEVEEDPKLPVDLHDIHKGHCTVEEVVHWRPQEGMMVQVGEDPHNHLGTFSPQQDVP